VPKEAVKVADGKATITVIGEENEASVREVQLGASDEKFTQVVSGLRAGDKVVTLAYRPVRDGQKVKIGKDEPEGGQGEGRGGRPGGGGEGGAQRRRAG
jgi:multidrug efflux system membrane fusion protein